ncbi:VQ motif [Musa troglodytarum]|uniref:VQ motif n=1 Tax=Musa troglodytarum TaxID=320322 RepID=A0A9E7L5E7_9LILI|nr:VQ motif [Musa troglodytarum]
MSPSARDINGPRPSAPLRIHKGSHLIHRPPSSSGARCQRNHPVVIYTHSPKVIHTQASDFMALVQKLTGRSQSPEADTGTNSSAPPPDVSREADAVSGDSSSRFISSSSSSATTMSRAGFDPAPPPNLFWAETPPFPSAFLGCMDASGAASPSVVEAMNAAHHEH